MKYLKIEDNKGYYLKVTEEDQDNSWVEIDKIGKEDLMELLNKAISTDFEMDNHQEKSLAHKAHQIVYKNLFEKFTELLENKSRFKDESENLYKKAFEKYSTSEESSDN